METVKQINDRNMGTTTDQEHSINRITLGTSNSSRSGQRKVVVDKRMKNFVQSKPNWHSSTRIDQAKYQRMTDQAPCSLKEQLSKICNSYRDNTEPGDFRYIDETV